MHFAQILPGRGPFRAFGEKGMHTARFLPARAPLPPQREGRGRGRRAVGAMRMGRAARWARCRCGRGRGGMGAIWAGPQRDDPDDDSGPARYRHGETRVAAGQRAGDGAQQARAEERCRNRGARGSVGPMVSCGAVPAVRRGPVFSRNCGRRGRRSGRGKRMDTVARARLTRCARTGGGYSPKCASIAATRSFSASMSC